MQAAERGNAKAMHNLAVLDADGGGKGANYKSAAQWFRKAADRGVADSQFNLGILYARGIGVEQNLAESFKWFSLAAAQGDADSGRKRDDSPSGSTRSRWRRRSSRSRPSRRSPARRRHQRADPGRRMGRRAGADHRGEAGRKSRLQARRAASVSRYALRAAGPLVFLSLITALPCAVDKAQRPIGSLVAPSSTPAGAGLSDSESHRSSPTGPCGRARASAVCTFHRSRPRRPREMVAAPPFGSYRLCVRSPSLC